MKREVFKLFIGAIYPALISLFIYTFAFIFRNQPEVTIILSVTNLLALAFFTVFGIGVIGYFSTLIASGKKA